MKNQKAFTVIELIVVVSIIAILATIVSTSIVGYIKESKEASVVSLFGQLGVAATKYQDANGGYDNICVSNNGSDFQRIYEKLATGDRMWLCSDTSSSDSSGWFVCILFADGFFENGNYCADYKGFKGLIPSCSGLEDNCLE